MLVISDRKHSSKPDDTHIQHFTERTPIEKLIVADRQEFPQLKDFDDGLQGGSNMTGTNCDLFTHKSVPAPCIIKSIILMDFFHRPKIKFKVLKSQRFED
jgi:hypothetical protein